MYVSLVHIQDVNSDGYTSWTSLQKSLLRRNEISNSLTKQENSGARDRVTYASVYAKAIDKTSYIKITDVRHRTS